MINTIRKSKVSKVIASYLAIQLMLATVQPSAIYALTSGPSQPEFNSFTPIGTSDMVNLSTGDFNYNIPIMDVGGYPLNLSYDSGITMDQEASWVGLGWNLNVGQINRQVRGLPDDFNGDEMQYEDNLKKNETVGFTFNINPQFVGLGDVADVSGGAETPGDSIAPEFNLNAGITIQHNNYTGVSFEPSYGISFSVANNISVGAQLSSSATNGASVNATVGISPRKSNADKRSLLGLNANTGLGYNSRQGLTAFSIGVNTSAVRGLDKNDIVRRSSFGNLGGRISFIDNTFTPTNRAPYKNSNISFATSLGPDVFGVDLELGVTGFYSIQNVLSAERIIPSFGYNNTHLATRNDVLDFNREKEAIVTKKTLVLPMTNYTHDIYSINGQGTGGIFKPFRSQVGRVYSQRVSDVSDSDSFGGEFEGGVGWHVGVDFKLTDVVSTTGIWESPVVNYFEESINNTSSLEEKVYYKSVGQLNVDQEASIFYGQLKGRRPIRIGIGGGNGPGKFAQNKYEYLETYSPPPVNGEDTNEYSSEQFTSPIKRTKRELRNQAVIPVTRAESQNDPLIAASTVAGARNHHLAGYKIINPDGARYVYGETAYNNTKVEESFYVNDDNNAGEIDVTNGTIASGPDLNGDDYFNKITTPSYAHTFLLSSVLSTDYEDITGNGPSLDDLGAYTIFNYREQNNFNWRIPYSGASYNPGLNTNRKDQRGSVISGTKELKYIETIETKTHVAYFHLSDRQDGKGSNESLMSKIEKIYLFSRPEFEQFRDVIGSESIDDMLGQMQATAIKVAHFDYDYLLCQNTPNSEVETEYTSPYAGALEKDYSNGKLTLTKVYFTYRNSYMGSHTPYKFYYKEDLPEFNPDYALKSQDIWGNYKPNEATSYDVFDNPMSPQEFPFVQQENRALQNQFAGAWSLSSVKLPSGGDLQISYESDDYAYVQDRKAMRMFKVKGVAPDLGSVISSINDVSETGKLYNPSNYQNQAKYLIVELPEDSNVNNYQEFVDRFLGDHKDKPIYFRFMLNMTPEGGQGNGQTTNDYEYVTGYIHLDLEDQTDFPEGIFDQGGIKYAAIPMKFSDLEGGINTNKQVNPISKAGWYFGRTNLPKEVYGLPPYTNQGLLSIIEQLKADIGAITEIATGPNGKLRNHKLIARHFVKDKSWIRLLEPSDRKLGGGVRVAKIEMHDQWDAMLGISNDDYNQFYGQEYSYDLDRGGSSGVATYEPNMSKENPFVEPFYNGDDGLIAPKELNYVEKPFGESFFPSPSVTYSRVKVKNLKRTDTNDEGDPIEVRKHATGEVVNDFYTSKDFPTIANYTTIDGPDNWYTNSDDFSLGNLLGLEVETTTELTLSQGFVVETNDMNGKQKKQSVYNEIGEFISGVSYEYQKDANGNLVNKVPVIYSDGTIAMNVADDDDAVEIGVDYDVVNDFNESYSYSNTLGLQANVAAIPLVPPLVPLILPITVPTSARHTNILHTVTTTKVIHRRGIQTKKVAFDLGASVSTENLAWDAQTGQVLLTKTANEYNDDYYNFNFPAYWAHPNMGQASVNIGAQGELTPSGESQYSQGTVLTLGDELAVTQGGSFEKLWVVKKEDNVVTLMDAQGDIYQEGAITYKVTRSGNRNLQNASMASVTLMRNPLDVSQTDIDNGHKIDKYDFIAGPSLQQDLPVPPNTIKNKIINASAVEYDDFWNAQCEGDIIKPIFERDSNGNLIYDIDRICINPYLYNIKGDFRAVKSYAYLTGRLSPEGLGVRDQGFFKNFNVFYDYNESQNKWTIANNALAQWTYASEVTTYSPYGAELENKDALDRYSAAQYGYQYTLPTAVTSNSKYREMGFDGFEDYLEEVGGFSTNTHFGFQDEIAPGNISNNAHTGRKSIRVPSGATINLTKSLETCNDE